MKRINYKSYDRISNRDDVIEEIANTSKQLINVDLSRVDLSGLDLSGCDLSGSRLDYGWLKHTVFDGAILNGTSFRNAMLDYSSFRNVVANGVSFPGSHIRRSNFSGADLSFGSFVRATVVDTPFDDAELYKVNLAGALIQQCSLCHANLKEIKGWRMWVVGSNFTGARFRSASVRGTAFESCNFSDCDWQDADLRRVAMISSTYDHHELRNAKLEGASIMRSGELVSVFISHTGEDKVFARKLAEDLRTSGISVWLDEWEIRVGHSITEKVNDALDRSNYIIVILSERFFKKSWPMRELRTAMMKQSSVGKTFILPVKIDDAPMPSLISDIAYADFRSDYEAAFEQLLSGLFEG